MDKSQLVTLLCDLNAVNLKDYQESLRNNYEHAIRLLNCTDDPTKETYESKCIHLNFYILKLLNNELSKSQTEVLSVQETKNVKRALANLVSNGILGNLQPNLPHRVDLKRNNQEDVLHHYNILKSTTHELYKCTKQPNLRLLILPHLLPGILVATYQLAHCPVKKPSQNDDKSKFVMSEETYARLLNDQAVFREVLEDMSRKIHPSIFLKETMSLFQCNSPVWFKKSVSSHLTKTMLGKKGVENIASAMLDGHDNDTSKTWKIVEVFTRLIMSCRKLPDFPTNILRQVVNLLDVTKTNPDLLVFEQLVISCVKSTFCEDNELCKVVFVNRIASPLLLFASKEHDFGVQEDVTDDVKQAVRLLYGCFVDSVNSACLPVDLLRGLIDVMFHLHRVTVKSALRATAEELRGVLMKCLQCCSTGEIHQLLDNFLFGFTVTDVAQMRNDVVVDVDGGRMIVKTSPHLIVYTTADAMDAVYNLMDTSGKVVLFGYLLKCINEKKRYFPDCNSKELLGDEEHATGIVLGRLLSVHTLLSQLADNKDVQHSLKDKPDEIIHYIHTVLRSSSNDLVFVAVMIVDKLVSNSSSSALFKYNILTESLEAIRAKTTDDELRSLCHKIVSALDCKTPKSKCEMSAFQKALDDIHDPLLPVRGHGLLTLSKLIEGKDEQAMQRKQYLLNLFQLHLKDPDSFIYLTAIRGLASLADAFPDAVVEVLCEEFAELKDSETRLKLGEALVRVVKMLGEMAPKYKAQLLNTLLAATKDDDHLVRASSLSNLGEVCRVLHYSLGSIVSEVLVCVHAVIGTDKAVEARRAAVTVIRQLFVGLKAETIAFLKEDILQVYRTLKQVFYNDGDDVVRLQAQLALEELNENMKQFVFPKPSLNFDKKIVMLD